MSRLESVRDYAGEPAGEQAETFRAAVLPVPYDGTSTWGKGAAATSTNGMQVNHEQLTSKPAPKLARRKMDRVWTPVQATIITKAAKC